jgi:hypothetical protein
MAEDKPSLHIDTDWKKQAQEEKQRLVEQEQKRAQEQQQRAAAPPIGAMGGMAGLAAEVAATTGGAAPSPGASRGPARGGRRETPEASLPSLVQSIMTQVLYYLGDLAPRGAEPNLNLDMAKHHIDTLGMLEEKTKGNLTPEEQRTLDGALYETRMRFVSVASQLMGP